MADQTKQIIGFGLCALMTGVMVYHSYRKPYNNWDEIGYVGSAISWSVKSPIEAQKLTFRFLREATSESSFSENTNISQYRKAVYHDPSVFALQLPFYKVKAGYVALVWLSWKLGVNPVRATSAISALAAGCLGLIVAAILVRALGGGAGVVVYPLVLVLGGLASAARFSTPDAESALVVFSALWLLRSSSVDKTRVGVLLLCLAVAIRPDNVILLLSCALVLTFATIVTRSIEVPVFQIAEFSAIGVVVWFLIGKLSGYYGWKVLVHHSFTAFVNSASDLKVFGWSEYGRALLSGIAWLVGYNRDFSPQFPLVVVLTYLLIYFQEERRDALLLAAVLMYMVVHFALFPSGQERLFYGVDTFIFAVGAIWAYRFQDLVVSLHGQTADRTGSSSGSFNAMTPRKEPERFASMSYR
jgi:hypothetical protein